MNVPVTASNSRIFVAAVGDITETDDNLLLDIQNLSVKNMVAEKNVSMKTIH